MEESEEFREDVLMLAAKIEPLLQFSADLINDIPLIEKAVKEIRERENFTLSGAPILGAMGLDYKEKNMLWQFRRKRIEALLNFVKVLRDTEIERKAFNERLSNSSRDIKMLEEYLK